MIQHRRCRRYVWESGPDADRFRWFPEYRTSDGDPCYPEDVECSECPVSLLSIGPGIEARKLTEMAMWASQVKAASGASFGGSDSSKWPAWWFDAVAIVEQERVAEHKSFVEMKNQKARG